MSDFKAKCIKIDFGWGSAPDPAGSLQRSPTPSWNKGDLLLEEEERCRGGESRRERGKEEKKRKEKKGE